jgi:hypothetical protein
LPLHKGDINAVETGARRARRIRSGRDRGDPGASGRAAIAARARAPAISDPAPPRAGSVDQSRARRRAAAADLKVLIWINQN